MTITGSKKKDIVLVFVIITTIGLSIAAWQRFNNNNNPDTARAIKEISSIQTTSIDPELVDGDGDGLNLKEERTIGTNPQKYDTDDDTLSDYKEYYQTKTNPIKKDTDDDRYDDNEDSSPLKKNSANIHVIITSQEVDPNFGTISLLIVATTATYTSGGVLSPSYLALLDKELYSIEVNTNILNDGDDFSSYLTYDLNLKSANEILTSKNIKYDKIDVGFNKNEHYSFSVKVEDIPEQLLKLINNQIKPTVFVDNVNFEKF